MIHPHIDRAVCAFFLSSCNYEEQKRLTIGCCGAEYDAGSKLCASSASSTSEPQLPCDLYVDQRTSLLYMQMLLCVLVLLVPLFTASQAPAGNRAVQGPTGVRSTHG
jgi:hypothetical protein